MSNQIAARVIAATSPVDRLGALRAQIAALEKIETVLIEEIKGWGAGVYPADVFSATAFSAVGLVLDRRYLSGRCLS